MRSLRRFAALAVGLAALAVPSLPGVAAAGRPARGWVVDRGVRFEAVDDRRAPLTVAGVGTYRGAITVTPNGTVVDDVALEDYVKGIAEVPATWPAEALKAQAIAARTYALYQITRRATGPVTEWRAAGADICATQDCQVYAGVQKEQSAPAWAQAVEATRGQAIFFGNAPILAMYSSSNGGYSVPGSQPYLRSVKDPDDAASPLSHWRYAMPLQTVGAAFGMPGETFDVGRAGDQIIITSRLDDGTQQQTSQTATAFRDRMNAVVPPPDGLPKTVPSTRFTVFTNGDGVVIDGRGYGHGVGMSQFGALGKAMRGMKAADILAAYYGGLRPIAVPPPQLPPRIKVAVATGRGETVVSSAGRFKVLDGNGSTLALLTGGAWHVLPAHGGKVRIVPPPGADAPLAISAVGFDGRQRAVRVRLNLATDVQATIVRAIGTAPVQMPSQILEPGERLVPLPDLEPGPVTVTLAANAGAGRVASVPFTFTMPDPSATTTTERLREGPHRAVEAVVRPVSTAAGTTLPWPLAVAAFLLAAVAGTAGGAVYRSRRSRSS